jgi:hypothetical protein
MKKLLVIVILGVAVFTVNAQNLKKGNLVGMHVITVNLNPNFTMEQAMDFFMKKYIPAAEANFPGMKIYLVKGIRGENDQKFGQIAVFESEAVRDKYYKEDGSYSEAGNEAMKKVQPVVDEFATIGTFSSKYTDWIIQ